MKTRLTLVLAVLATLGGVPAWAAPIPVQVKVQEAGDRIKLILDWKGRVQYKVHPAGSGSAMVVELTPAKLAAGTHKFPVQRGLIGVIEATQSDADTVRVKIPVMNAPVFQASSRGAQGGLQLMISTLEVDSSGRTAPQAAAPRPAASRTPAPSPRPAAASAPTPAPARSGVQQVSALQTRPAQPPAPAPAVSAGAPPAPVTAVGSGPVTSTQAPATAASSSRPAAAPAVVAAPAPVAAAPAPRPSAPAVAASVPSREYSLTLAGQDLRAVLTDLATDMGLRAALDPAVKGSVTTTIFNLDAVSTVEAILRTQQPTTYLYRFTDTELQVFPAGSAPAAAARPTPAPAPAVATAPPPPAVTVAPGDPTRLRDYFPIPLPKKAAQLAEGLRVLCPGATLRVDEPMNVILVEASPADMEQVRKVLDAVGR